MNYSAEEGNKRVGDMSNSEIRQCVQDVVSWFNRKNNACRNKKSSNNLDLEKLQKVIGYEISFLLKSLLLENDGSTYIYDKILLSSDEIVNLHNYLEKSSGFKPGMILFCGDNTSGYILAANDQVLEWDSDDGVGDVISNSFSKYIETYRNQLLCNSLEFIEGIGVVETSNAVRHK